MEEWVLPVQDKEFLTWRSILANLACDKQIIIIFIITLICAIFQCNNEEKQTITRRHNIKNKKDNKDLTYEQQ